MARPRYFMGDHVERAIAFAGVDRNAVIAYVWHCGCRNRHRHYHEVCAWAEVEWGSAAEARGALEGMLAKGKK
jgi:hypothetical protein